jgi:hypothetical protein
MAGKPKDPNLLKSYTLRVRMTEAERDVLHRAAKVRDLETSTWARVELLRVARQILKGK